MPELSNSFDHAKGDLLGQRKGLYRFFRCGRRIELITGTTKQEIKLLHPSSAIKGLGLIWGIDVSGFADETKAGFMAQVIGAGELVVS